MVYFVVGIDLECCCLKAYIKNIAYYLPENVEEKIRFLCAQVHEVEWSGILFYKKAGTMEDGSLVITCVDIFPMDIGTSTYTEFDNSPDAVSYMCDHSELLAPDVYNGLIH